MLAIFDIDGTICDTQEVEGRCFAQAFEEVFGFPLKTVDWTKFEEPTSSGIVRSLCAELADREALEVTFRDRFVDLLRKEKPHFPGDFRPLPGATEFLSQLSSDPSVTVAFATGGFDTEAEFKLRCCGIDLRGYPHATSSDTPRRRDIIRLAVNRANGDLHSAVYFGDAPWDVEACRILEIPMIGMGRRIDQLQELGLAGTFRDFTT
ncbi:MAG: HAD family hydrolase, partial [Verrucomicrobiota bacterium]